MSKVMPVTGALVGALLAASGAQAQVTSNQDSAVSPWPTAGRVPARGSSADTAFIRQVIRGNYTEVALGRLADSPLSLGSGARSRPCLSIESTWRYERAPATSARAHAASSLASP